jgi:hypothetical protein
METLKKEMEEIVGKWNGDESGWEEDQAGIATEILEHIAAIESLIKELNGTN